VIYFLFLYTDYKISTYEKHIILIISFYSIPKLGRVKQQPFYFAHGLAG
jgi:hypothetical protein